MNRSLPPLAPAGARSRIPPPPPDELRVKTKLPSYQPVPEAPHAEDTAREGPSRRQVLLIVGGSLAALVAVASLLTVVLGGPMLQRLREKRNQEQSRRHVQAICTALLAYAQNHNQRYPPSSKDWEYLLDRDGFVRLSVFRAPGAPPDIDCYFFVPGGEQKFDSSRIIVFENPALWTTGGGNIGFDDGQVRWCDKEEFEALISKIQWPPGSAPPAAMTPANPQPTSTAIPPDRKPR